jgi:hypothetical protein
MAMVGAAYSDGDQMSMSEKQDYIRNDQDLLLLGFAFDALVAGSRPSSSLSSGLCKRLIVLLWEKSKDPTGWLRLFGFLGLIGHLDR